MEKINISELLKDCPTGYPLDCTMYEDVYFDFVDELNIIHCYIQYETHKTSITFNQHGTPHNDIKSKCVIFPKGKTTWEGFHRPFKDGDVLYIYVQEVHGFVFTRKVGKQQTFIINMLQQTFLILFMMISLFVIENMLKKLDLPLKKKNESYLMLLKQTDIVGTLKRKLWKH